MIDFLRHHWYDLGAVSAAVTVYYFHVNRKNLNTIQRWLIASFLTVLVHQFEEYRFPGGFPAAMNIGVQASPRPTTYPLNAHSAMITNTVATYGLYLPPIFFPNLVWLGIGPVILGFGQVIIHGININSKMRTFYNPGLASTLLMHVPVGIAYIQHVRAAGKLTPMQLGLGLAYGMAIMYLLLGKYTFTWAPDMDSPYPFTAAEMQRGGVATYLAQA
ncbi:uncharacterized protein N0V89_006335 [Didymosphaeria variabile]|uniref:HXXEE domain-containing protein n=1 Tax=Didymosphaeria variabile TaxID=1932322 RepID=A0A9W8XNX0_9PLEO|nr:uncharacterized protein N0V89_006335 [Didymosphaeria variabile]KAJ4354598.1 hypothetical protein N0V89_006335 [Didymosphaeria variabile]